MTELKINFLKFLGNVAELCGLAGTVYLAKYDWINMAAIVGYLTITFSYLEGRFWQFYETATRRP